MFCKTISQDEDTPGIWNPLPWFTTVAQDHQLRDIGRSTRSSPPPGRGRFPLSPGSSPRG